MQTSISLQNKYQSKGAAFYHKRIHNSRLDLNLIFTKLFSKLFSLILVFSNKYMQLGSEALDEFLDIKPEEAVGYYSPDEILKKLEQMNKKKEEPQKATSEIKQEQEKKESAGRIRRV